MIPKSLSGETNQDSEPHLTVNIANAQQIIGTAFSPNPGGGSRAPVYVSQDGGDTWKLNAIVPSTSGSSIGTGDITTCFNRNGSTLYAGILRAGTGNLEFLRTSSPFGSAVMTVLKSRPSADQPFTHATTVPSGPDAGKDRLYIGDNDFAAPGGQTQTIDQSLNAGWPLPRSVPFGWRNERRSARTVRSAARSLTPTARSTPRSTAGARRRAAFRGTRW